MKNLKAILFVMLLALPFVATRNANAQVAVGVGIGPAVVAAPVDYGPPACDWGYYSYYPYACAPYGYYGPTWFTGGVFIGVVPGTDGAGTSMDTATRLGLSRRIRIPRWKRISRRIRSGGYRGGYAWRGYRGAVAPRTFNGGANHG